eukprot:scaffold2004_cov420-Prasinococcus_capsulatus_cf.AAC.10
MATWCFFLSCGKVGMHTCMPSRCILEDASKRDTQSLAGTCLLGDDVKALLEAKGSCKLSM